MKTLAVTTSKHNTFTSGLHPAQVKFIRNIAPEEFAKKIKDEHGIACDFQGNQIIAGLCGKTIKICKKLGISLPEEISVEKMKFSDRRTIALCSRIPSWSGKKYRIVFNPKYFKNLDALDRLYNKKEECFGSSHILKTPLHEFLHSHYFKTRTEPKSLEDDWKFKYLVLGALDDEIAEKISYNSTRDNFELYADYWAKEICKSLDKNWQPRYNPFETPKVKVSPKLREFINTLTNPEKALEMFKA